MRAAEEMRARLPEGKLHALVNNAAISPKGPKGERLGTLDSSQELWRQVFEVNLFSTIWLAQGLKNELAKAHGAIVNVTSIAGSRVHPFAGAAYSISKAAAAALTREMAADFGPWGCGSTPSPRARSTPPSCRPAPRRSWRPSRCAAWASRRRSQKRSIICVPINPVTSPAPN